MQKFWQYVNSNQGVFDIGLYHGDKSGHLVIYCGKEIIKIDFNILHSQNYSFYLGEELFEVNINYSNNSTNYTLTNLNLNKIIHETDQKIPFTSLYRTKIITILIVFMLLLLGLLIKIKFF